MDSHSHKKLWGHPPPSVRQDDKVEPGVTALPADVHGRRVVRLGYGSVFASDKHSNPVLPGWLAGCLGRSRVNGKARRSMTSTRLLKRILEAVGIRQVVGCGAEGAPMTSSVLIK